MTEQELQIEGLTREVIEFEKAAEYSYLRANRLETELERAYDVNAFLLNELEDFGRQIARLEWELELAKQNIFRRIINSRFVWWCREKWWRIRYGVSW